MADEHARCGDVFSHFPQGDVLTPYSPDFLAVKELVLLAVHLPDIPANPGQGTCYSDNTKEGIHKNLNATIALHSKTDNGLAFKKNERVP